MDIEEYKVYIKVDNNDNIIDINSSDFLMNHDGWIEIDHGTGDKYHHAQNNYLDKLIINPEGQYRYKWVNNKIVEMI